jgi:pimeloyl-ACP methyl ester carboxylesterase
VKANGLNMYYEEHGEGEPLILLHGGTISQTSWSQHVPILQKRYHVITPDMRGHGKTDNPYQMFSYRAMADDINAFIDALNLHKPHICGFSDGGQVALELAMNYPNQLSTLMMTGVFSSFSESYLKDIKNSGFLGPGKVDTELTIANSSKWYIDMLRSAHAPGPDYWKTLLYQLSFMWYTPLNYSDADLRRVVVPTLVMCGDRDEPMPVEQAVEFYRMIPGSEMFVSPGCHHAYPLTRPEFFCEVITDFITRRGSLVLQA